jgi:hypothetical protein
VKQNLVKHMGRMRNSEKYQPNAAHLHLDLDDAILGFKSRISRGEFQRLDADERHKRMKNLRNESQRRHREQCRMILGTNTRGDGKVLCLFLCSSIVYNEGRSPLFLSFSSQQSNYIIW